MPLQREFHGHQIVSSDDMRRHEVFAKNDRGCHESIGVHPTLGLAIKQTRGHVVDEPIQPEEPDEPLPIDKIGEET